MAKEKSSRRADGPDKVDGASKSKQVDALFAQWSAELQTPGAAVRVMRYGRPIHEKEYGLANIEKKFPIVPETAFLLASLTKQFTALAIMVLVEKGVLSYDNRLSEFFPSFPVYARRISVRHLLHHTSGLREYRDALIDAGLLDKSDSYPRSVNASASPIEPTSKQTLEALARQKDLLFAPGEEYCYSNSGYLVLAQIIEIFKPHSYPAFVKEHIFGPAKMKHSEIPVERWREVPRRAVSYGRKEKGYEDIDYTPLNLLYGEDGIYTTVKDMVLWDQVLYTGKLVKQATLDEAFVSGRLNDGRYTCYGYGWGVEREFVSHAGVWLGFNTYIIRYRSRRLTIIVLANCEQLKAEAIGEDIARIYLDEK